MGEAKRRKQLGLMPEVENREVILYRDGRMEGDALPEAVRSRLAAWAETGVRWDARYRTTFIGTGIPRELLKTEAELMDIPVPDRMRLRLGLLSGSAAWLARELEENPDAFFEEDGETRRQLNIRATEYDYNGSWAALPEFEPDSTLRYLMQHPAVMADAEGEDFVATLRRSGGDVQVTLEPEAPAEHREALERAALTLLGEGDEAWLEDHHALLDDDLSEENEGSPAARRFTLRLTPVPLVLSPTVQVLERSGDMDVVFRPGAEAYSMDGESWRAYPEQVDRDAQLQALLAQMGLDGMNLEDLLGAPLDAEGEDGELEDGRTIDAEVVEPDGGQRDGPA